MAEVAPVLVPLGGWRCGLELVPRLAAVDMAVPLVPALPVPTDPLIPPRKSVPVALLPFMPFMVLLPALFPLAAAACEAAT
ncbi:MAG: hypothetical protein M3Z05_14435 [Gemmatimonadota bacterium]|nr:hypothetical protein [Gemmatimonadota bacterium]